MDIQKGAKIAAMVVVAFGAASAIYVAVTEGIRQGAELLAIVLGGLAMLIVERPAGAYVEKAGKEAEKAGKEAEKVDVELDNMKRHMRKSAPWDDERIREMEELAAELPNGHVEWFDSAHGKSVEERERIGVIHFEPEPGRKAETDLILDPDGNLRVNGTSEDGRPQGAEIAAAWVFDAIRRLSKRTDQ